MTNPAWTPSPHESDPAARGDATRPPGDEAAAEAERVRQGRVVLRTRVERITFVAGLALPVVVLAVLWLAHVL